VFKIEPSVQAIIFIYTALGLIAVVTFILGRGKTADFKQSLWGIVLPIPFGTTLFFTYVYPYNFLYVLEHPHGYTLIVRVLPFLGIIGLILLVMNFMRNFNELASRIVKKIVKRNG